MISLFPPRFFRLTQPSSIFSTQSIFPSLSIFSSFTFSKEKTQPCMYNVQCSIFTCSPESLSITSNGISNEFTTFPFPIFPLLAANQAHVQHLPFSLLSPFSLIPLFSRFLFWTNWSFTFLSLLLLPPPPAFLAFLLFYSFSLHVPFHKVRLCIHISFIHIKYMTATTIRFLLLFYFVFISNPAPPYERNILCGISFFLSFSPF